jgi:hypothetical protein
LKELLSWLPDQLKRNDDFLGAVLGAMLLRHFSDDLHRFGGLLERDINRAVGRGEYLFAGVGELINLIEHKIGRHTGTSEGI